jgi:putative heme-binding domain-containing protein
MAAVHIVLKTLEKKIDVPRQLRAMWCLHVTGGAKREWLAEHLNHSSEHVRAWALRLLVDGDSSLSNRQGQLLAADPSGLVRLYLASTLQRATSPEMPAHLVKSATDSEDRVLPLLLWYGLEPGLMSNKSGAVELARQSRIPRITQFIARRLTEGAGDAAELAILVQVLGQEPRVDRDVLQGMRQGLRGRKKAAMPEGWQPAYLKLIKSPAEEVQESAHVLGLIFQDPLAHKLLNAVLVDRDASVKGRTSALQALVDHQDPRLVPTLFQLMDDPVLREPAVRGLAAFNDPKTPAIILQSFARMSAQEKQASLSTLASRPAYALALLDAIDHKIISRNDVSAFTARQLQDLRDPKVSERLAKMWGQIRSSSAERKALIAKYKNMLTPDVVAKADAGNGRLVFKRLCSQCHILYGAGTKIGPDLTGSNRADLHYVLENVIDPNAVIGRDYQLTNITTTTGRLVSGIVVEETERAVTVQTATERLVLAKSDIDERRLSPVSMMPEGQLEQMTLNELRDLLRYLATKEQVPLP